MKTNETGQRKVGLLDVNVLIALIDPAHEFHGSAHVWFKTQPACRVGDMPDHGKRVSSDYGQARISVSRSHGKPVRGILAELVQVDGHRVAAHPTNLSLHSFEQK